MRGVFAVAACLALALGGAEVQGEDDISSKEVKAIRGPGRLGGEYFLGVVKGEPRLVKMSDAFRHWVVRRTAKGTVIRLLRADRKSGGLYLSYDPTGKRKGTFLTKKPGPGSYWTVTRGRQGRNGLTAVITAAGGKVKGWHLDSGSEAEKLNGDDEPFRAREAVLTEKPKVVPRYDLEEVSP